LCLSAASLAVNRTLVAGLIADHGVRQAELIVRGWVANLALPPIESEAALLQAVEAGTCGLAVVSGSALHDYGRPTIAATLPRPGYYDVWAVGINRHARSPDAARGLAEWLVREHSQLKQFEATGQRPVTAAGPFELPTAEGKHDAALFGFHETDAAQLAERARWY
jgi:iron(III) transport system substrate-binding protein